jgi:hypothetical protein
MRQVEEILVLSGLILQPCILGQIFFTLFFQYFIE